jgi:hypothetical protein
LINTTGNFRDSFVSEGFVNWKKGLIGLDAHNSSEYHRQATMTIKHQSNSAPVDEQITQALNELHVSRRSCFSEQANCAKYLVRQGLAMRNSDEENSNMTQLLKLSQNSFMAKYLAENKYLSHHINSEIIKEIYRQVMKDLLDQIKSATYFAIVIDETRDISGIEQLAVVIRWVSEDYTVYEDIIGFHQADICDADSIVKIIKTVLLSVDLDIQLIRGQTYDGASVLQGHKSGVAKQILLVNPKALPTHCLNHNLNLILQEAASINPTVSGAFTAVQSVCSIIRASPKRLAVFRNLQMQSAVADRSACVTTIKPLCETRWTCRTASLTSVLENYEVILDTLEEVSKSGGSSKGAKEAPQLLNYLEKFSTVFGLKMCLVLFSPVEDMAKQLQSKQLDASLVRTVKQGLLRYLTDLKTDNHFEDLYESSKEMCEEFGLKLPALPRRNRRPKRMEDYYGVPDRDHNCDTPEEYFKGHYFTVIDLVTRKLEERFDQETLNHLIAVENIVINAAKGSTIPLPEKLSKCLEGDIDCRKLMGELKLLASFIKEVQPGLKDVTSIQTVLEVMKEKKLYKTFSELHQLLKLYLTVPLSNATAERSFSALRRVKTYLRSSLTQEHLNHFLILNAHREILDRVDMEKIALSVMKVNERRRNYFGV